MSLSHTISFAHFLPLFLATFTAIGCTGSGSGDRDVFFLNGVTHGEGRFVAAGYDEHVVDGSPGLNTVKTRLMSSTDGLSWTRHDADLPASRLQDVAFGNGVFVAVGGDPLFGNDAQALALFSEDGTTWSEIARPTTSALRQILFADGHFLLVAADGQTFTSADGKAFEPAGKPGDGLAFRRITFGGGKYVAWGFNQNVFVSSDAMTYTPVPNNVDEVNCIHFFQNEFRGVGIVNNGADEAPTNLRFVLSSPTGDMWSKVSGSFPCWGGVVEYDGAIFSADGNKIYRSSDGKTFQEVHTIDGAFERLDMVVGDGKVVVVGTSEIETSADGQVWKNVVLQ